MLFINRNITQQQNTRRPKIYKQKENQYSILSLIIKQKWYRNISSDKIVLNGYPSNSAINPIEQNHISGFKKSMNRNRVLSKDLLLQETRIFTI